VFRVKVLENVQVELKFKFPLETVGRGDRIGSCSLLFDWAWIYPPDTILELHVPQRLSYKEVEKTVFSPIAFRFYHELERYLQRLVGSVPTLCVTKKDIPFQRIKSECVVWFKASPHSPKHRTIATIHLSTNVLLSQPIGVRRFYKFAKSFCSKVKKKVMNNINKYLPPFLRNYEEHGKVFFNIKTKNDWDFDVRRYGFVPTDDIRKLSPLFPMSYVLEFVNCDEKTVRSLISNVKKGKNLKEKVSIMAFILSTLDYKVVSSSEPPNPWSFGTEPRRPETFLMKLSEWLKVRGDENG